MVTSGTASTHAAFSGCFSRSVLVECVPLVDKEALLLFLTRGDRRCLSKSPHTAVAMPKQGDARHMSIKITVSNLALMRFQADCAPAFPPAAKAWYHDGSLQVLLHCNAWELSNFLKFR
jgi:hypothetical protein